MSLIQRLDARAAGFDGALQRLLAYDATQDQAIEASVRAILAAVQSRGDAALLEYTARFDGVQVSDAGALAIPQAELQAALSSLPAEQRAALQAAAQRIDAYHQHQLTQSWRYTEPDGTVLGQKITPLDSVGLYVPGGKAAYPSSVLMNAIPAKVAGVDKLIMVTPTPKGERNQMVLAAAAIAGVDQVYAIGGAQAVAALAYGTQTIPAVDKITGPGNAYVAAAKRHVFGTVGIDMIAGPSEILIIADGSAPAAWLALDMFAQAEHDELAQAIMLCPDAGYLEQVYQAIQDLLPQQPRLDILRSSLGKRGALIQVKDLAQACAIANTIAPEHLELAVQDPDALVDQVRHAGAIFMGAYSSESLGDYCAGPNHVLPTARTARFSSPLGVYDFQKRSSIIQVSRAGAQNLGKIAATLATGEGLAAHAQSAMMRINHKP